MVTAFPLFPSNLPYRSLSPAPTPFPPSVAVSMVVLERILETSQPRLIHQIISAHRTDAIEIVKGQWPP